MKDHEKFMAFCLLGGALLLLAVMLYLRPLPDSSAYSGVLQILNLIVGGFLGGFGAACQALLKANSDTVKVTNTPDEPVPTQEK